MQRGVNDEYKMSGDRHMLIRRFELHNRVFLFPDFEFSIN